MKFGLKLVVLIFCNMFIVAFVTGQKGFQLGFGLGTMIMDYNKYSRGNLFKTVSSKSTDPDFKDLRISGNNPYYLDVKVDYAFSPQFQIRSGVQYRIRDISYFGSNSGTVKMYAVPLIFNYRLPVNTKHALTLGFNVGLTLDRYFGNNFGSFVIQDNTTTTNILVKEDYYNGNFSSLNGSFRYGIELEKDLGKHGRIGIQLMYSYLHTGTQVDIYTTMIQNKYEDAVNPFLLTSTKTEKIKYDGNQSGFLLGLNYNFGKFSWNVK